MKKILYLHAGAELYGADKVLLELLKNINKEQFLPYVVLPEDGELARRLSENNIKIEILNYPILRRKYFNFFGVIKYIRDYINYSKKLIEISKRENIDLIHTNTAAVLEGVMIKRKLKIPHIWHIHEIIVKPKFMNKILSFIIAKNSSITITVSNAVKKHLLTASEFKNIEVIYNGVDNKVYNPNNETDYLRKEFNIPKEAIIVGMIGRINAWKGQSDFLKSLDIVLEKNKNVYAMLVGGVFDGEEWRLDEIKSQISRMKNRDRVVMSDYREDVKNIQSLYDIFILPSINPDPLPTVVLEAMASGTPVIGYNHGGICEMIVDNECGYLVEVGDINKMANAIMYLLNDSKKLKTFSENALKRQKQYFSLNSYIDNFEKIYKGLS